LLHILQEMLRQTLQISAPSDQVARMTRSDFELRARQVNIHDVTPFLGSRFFSANGFRLVGSHIEKAL
jgi:hypothetical protein